MVKKRYDTPHYNYGSSAPDIYRQVNYPKMPNTDKRRQLKVEKRIQRRIKLRRRISYFLSTLMVFLASVAFVWGCSVVSQKQHDLKIVKNEVQELKNKVNNSKSLIAASTNLDHIKERAINELHMSEPLDHQIVIINIEKTSYTLVE